MSKNHPGIRPGSRKAKALLEKVAKAHKIDVKSLVAKANYRHFTIARREYCILGLQAGISLAALAQVLCRDHTTIRYHQRPEQRARKRAQRLAWASIHPRAYVRRGSRIASSVARETAEARV